jgi:ubiquinone/menaquinone biosynthesis C-methylase UbiE
VTHDDHVALIRSGVEGSGLRWLELGAGRGTFTLALLDLLGPDAEVIALDHDRGALEELERSVRLRFPRAHLRTRAADFTRPLPVTPGSLDGVLAANALHFVPDPQPVITATVTALRSGGRFVVVEYDADRGNPWVPWPFGFDAWRRMAVDAGLVDTRLVGRVPSRFLGSIYAAVSCRP